MKKLLVLALLVCLCLPVGTALADSYSARDTDRGDAVWGESELTIKDRPVGTGNEVYSIHGVVQTLNAGWLRTSGYLYYGATIIGSGFYGPDPDDNLDDDSVGFLESETNWQRIDLDWLGSIYYAGEHYHTVIRVELSGNHESYDDGWQVGGPYGYDVCTTHAAVDIALRNTNMLRPTDTGLYAVVDGQPARLKEYNLKSAHDEVKQNKGIPNNYQHFTIKDVSSLLSAEQGDGKVKEMKAFFRAVTPLQLEFLDTGDCIPGYWFSPKGDKAVLGILKADGSIVTCRLQLEHDSQGEPSWSVK